MSNAATYYEPANSTKSQRQGPSASYPIGYGLDFSVGNPKRFEVDDLSPEVVTANQRACEVRVQDWVESQGTVITR